MGRELRKRRAGLSLRAVEPGFGNRPAFPGPFHPGGREVRQSVPPSNLLPDGPISAMLRAKTTKEF